MKIKSISLGIFALLFSMTLIVSCGEAKKETKEVTEEEVSAEVEESKEDHSDHVAYQCPMDCEDGKTYKEAGSCPVCKMDLKAQNDTQASSTCKKGEDGKCACDEDECKCKNCPNRA